MLTKPLFLRTCSSLWRNVNSLLSSMVRHLRSPCKQWALNVHSLPTSLSRVGV
jgi:hypothetical protein